MAIENVVIAYNADISDISRKVKELQRINATVAKRLGADFTKGLTVVSSQLDRIRTVGKDIKLPLGGSTREVQTFSTVLKNANGQLVTVRENVAGTGKNIKVLSSTVSEGGKRVLTYSDHIKNLARRAALTIPIWFAIRIGIQGVTRTMRDGLGSIVSFDRALQKLRRNIEATSTNVDRDFQNVTRQIEEFSARTGKSVEEVTSAIQRFATVGFDIETSLQGGLRATQLAITLFGDVDETANAFARSLRVLTEDIDSAEEKQLAIANALALTDQLWQTNAFEVNEFSSNLEKFAGTAAIANLSIEDTLTLLATLSTGGLGNRAGRLLRSTLLRSLADIEKVSRGLDLDFDPESQPTIEFVLQLVGALRELRVEGNVPAELSETLGELFTVRGTEVLAALTALEETLKDNIALEPDVEKFDATLERILGTSGSLAEQFRNANREIGRTFVTGLVGGEDFDDSLQKILKTQLQILDSAEEFGQVVRDVFVATGVASLNLFITRLGVTSLSLTSIIALLTTLRTIALAPIPPVAITAVLTFSVLRFKNEAEKLAKEAEDQSALFTEIGARISKNIQKGLRKELSLAELTDTIIELETFGAEGLGFDTATVDRVLEVLKEIKAEETEIANVKKRQEEITKREGTANRKRKEIAELVLQSELEVLKARGVSTSELIRAEQLARNRLGIEKELLGQIESQLERERAISEERRLRADVGNEEIKLFRIAQKEGVDVARRIGDVLAGNLDFSTFVRRGGRELEVFKDQFEDIFESQQARAFFSGDPIPGLSGLRGGSTIDTEQQFDTRELASTNTKLILAQSRAVSLFESLQREQVSQTSATDKNTEALDNTTASIESLVKTFESGVPLFGQDAQRFVDFEGNRQLNVQNVGSRVAPVQSRQIIDLNLNIDGRNVNLTGTPEAVQRLANQAGEEVSRQVQQLINNIANNPQSPEAQAVRRRILEE